MYRKGSPSGLARAMSRSPSPASSLDYFQSSGSASEDDYTPRSRTVGKRKAGGKKKAGPSLKINLSALQRAKDAAAQYPVVGDVEEDEYGVDEDEEGYLDGLLGWKGVDLSNQALKADHAARPLWVDEYGNMYVCVHFIHLVTLWRAQW